jgi:hypothetical protein
MNDEDLPLDHQDLCFFSVLAARSAKLIVNDGRFPRGCSEAQILALARAGYLVSIPERPTNGTGDVRYDITPEGQTARNVYRFI